MSFSENFLIGAATAAHQVEGNNINSDFWAMEQMQHSMFAESSNDAVDHYHRYEEDHRRCVLRFLPPLPRGYPDDGGEWAECISLQY